MKTIDAIKLASKNLFRTKFRSFLTILGVVIGISAIVLFVSLGLGLEQITSNQIATVDVLTTLTVNQKAETASMEAGQPLTDDSINKFRKIDKVTDVSPSVNITGNVIIAQTSTGALIYGIKPENSGLEISELSSGKLMSDSGNDAVISSALAKAISPEPENLVGESVKIQILKNVDGMDYKADEILLNIVGIDCNETANIVYAPLSKIWDAGQFEKYSSVKIKVKSRKDIDKVRKELEDQGFSVTTIKDLLDQIDKIFLILQIILILIGGIGLLVASLGIINTMTISLLERTHEIGIMKAIGANNSDVKKLFFWESALIGIFGGLLGVGIAFVTGILFNGIINFLIRGSNQELNLFVLPVNFSIAIIAFSAIVSIFSGLYPAHRAQKISTIDALRE